MLLSEAIREGCKNTKPHVNTYFEVNSKNKIEKACVLGTALLTIFGQQAVNKDMIHLKNEFPILRKAVPDHLKPEEIAHRSRLTLFSALMCLNDNYGWSREAVAMWVEQIENYFSENSQESKQMQAPKLAMKPGD